MSAVHIPVPADKIQLDGELVLPPSARSVVLFAHGSGSSRFSPRNTYVAEVLQQRGIGTLLFDLLTREEDQGLTKRASTSRCSLTACWPLLTGCVPTRRQESMHLGYFGASTGAAAALQAAALLSTMKSGAKIYSRGIARRTPRLWPAMLPCAA